MRSPAASKGKFRYLSALSDLPIRQGGNVRLNLDGFSNCVVRIKSSWQDHVDLSCNEALLDVHLSEEDQTLTLSKNESSDMDIGEAVVVELTTPELINLYIYGLYSDIKIENKIEGDVMIQCESGDINIDKVRGKNIAIKTTDANITSRKLIEGADVLVKGGTINAKMINGDSVKILSESTIDVGAMYTRSLTMISKKDVNIGLMNGNAYVTSSLGGVTMNNIDGWFDVSSQNVVNLQVNKLSRHPSSSSGCKVFSKGSVFASVDPEMKASVDCYCLSTAGRAVVTIISDSFVTTEPAEGFSKLGPERTQGLLTGESKISKRPIFTKSNSSGKINLSGAEEQAASGPNHENGQPSIAISDSANEEQFDLALHAHGHVRLETLSWIEIIKRKHGFSDNDSVSPPKSVGRSASSKVRAGEIGRTN